MLRLSLLLCALVAMIGAQDESKPESLELSSLNGKIRGSFLTSRLGRKIYAFRGLRYAEPPTGQQRFKQAIPVAPWNEVFDATEEGPSCPQPGGRLQSEDCLRLNVYTTQLPSKNSSDVEGTMRPVIVYFHPGGYYGSSGQSYIEGPQYLMDQDIVLVVVNYRLASLGFFSTGDSLAPGNLGLKDQVESLRWVKKNIAAFGGDPNCVTIAGYSAGSWSISLHLLSPMSEGLFHRAIAMSGSATYQEPLPPHQKHLAQKQAELLGCPTDTTGSMLVCLNGKSAQEIGDSLPHFFEWHNDPILIWLPVVEPEVPGVERFLTAQPIDLIREGKFHHVPLITGVTKDEFGGVVVPMIEEARNGNISTFEDLNEHWDKIAPISFLYERNTPRSAEISTALKQFYLNDEPIGLNNTDGLAKLYADGVIGFSVHRLAHLMAKASKQPVYYYEFTYQGRFSHVTWNDTHKPYGVVHHDDLLYLFCVSFFPYFEENAPEIPTVERMTKIWANFAKTGEPIPRDDDKFANVTWSPFDVENKRYLEIGEELVMKTNLHADRMNEWERLFPLQPPTLQSESHTKIVGKPQSCFSVERNSAYRLNLRNTLFQSPCVDCITELGMRNSHFFVMELRVFLVAVAFLALTMAPNEAQSNANVNPQVSTPLGRIEGSFMKTRLDKQIYAFRGIRYAEAPTGDLRFKVAVPAKPWNDVFNASEEGPSCPRPSGRLMDEDCLRVNVYTTKLPATASCASVAEGTKKPVMVFFHPGGFYGFSGQSYLFGPQYILDQDIVLVTVNYRIGPLGFLATGDSVAPGNLGLKDQVIALRWVRDNIASFGGDPDSVTISGYSAGSWSVALHMMSPMSEGLFHRAISMSGSPTKGEPLTYEQVDYAKKLARIFKCPEDASEKIVECLRNQDAEAIAKTFSQFAEWHFDPIRVWSPVVEPNIPGLERFIVDQPANLIRGGRIHQVPFLAGVTRDEFDYLTMNEVVQARKGNDSIFRDLDQNWENIAPISFQYERNTPRSKRISQELRDYYFKGQSISLETVQGHAHCYADSIVGFPMHRLVHLVAGVSKKPVYYYRFIYEGRYSLAKWPNTQDPYGVVHHDDLQYLFYMSILHYFEPDAPETPIVEKMTAMWANFVKTGEPIPKNNKAFEGVIWEQFTPENNRYMEISRTLTMKTGVNLERMQVFENLFPLDPLSSSSTTTPGH
ncbi:uncharacterized protein [Venturia canescens]|uniref:uncharacterized protein n=1 Tax=Venturia canescens TaxID=32260 RepID=UPI001C9C9BCE|nr:uncharacterized protein LOC122407269 [Venturia canescens]